jgi:hypothetical protein
LKENLLRRKAGHMESMFRSMALISLAISLQAGPQSELMAQAAASGDADIYESVIRYQIKSWELAARTFCIQVKGGDAEEALLERLRPLPVKIASACQETDQKTMMRVVDKETKQNAVIFDVGVIRRVSDSEVEVEGGYLCASLCMASGDYHVIREKSGWRVTTFKWHLMS